MGIEGDSLHQSIVMDCETTGEVGGSHILWESCEGIEGSSHLFREHDTQENFIIGRNVEE